MIMLYCIVESYSFLRTRIKVMSAVLPRNKKKATGPKLSHSSDASKKMKKSFQGVNQNFMTSTTKGAEVVPHHVGASASVLVLLDNIAHGMGVSFLF